VLAGWLVFSFVPTGNLWIGSAMIIAASLYIANREARLEKLNQGATG
jgi:drug/metabolite transporter (DMT)-like permease